MAKDFSLEAVVERLRSCYRSLTRRSQGNEPVEQPPPERINWREYIGEYVVVASGRILANGKECSKVYDQFQASGYRGSTPVMCYISEASLDPNVKWVGM